MGYFDDNMLQAYAEEERSCPSLPKIFEFMEGKQLICTETAREKFLKILDLLGGENEIKRGYDFLSKVTVVKDEPSERSKSLICGTKVKEWHVVIFGTGDKLRATTMTSNHAFVRASQHQGIEFDVYLHSSRALSEKKSEPNQTNKRYSDRVNVPKYHIDCCKY